LKRPNQTYIIEGKRLPIGKANGIYKAIIPEVFTGKLINFFLEKYPFLKNETDELILGCALGTGGNMARFTALEAGFSEQTPAYTIDAQCASGIKAIILGDQQILSGANCVIAGGMESNSLAPRRGYQPNDQRFIDENACYTQATFAPSHFGETSLLKAAENLALKFNISKLEMIQWAVESHKKAINSIENRFLENVILPFQNNNIDQSVKANLTVDRLQKTETNQLIDHTNTAHLHDGACIQFLASSDFINKYSLKPTFQILASHTCGVAPSIAPIGVIYAAEQLLQKTGLKPEQIDLFEVNESFAINAVAFAQYFQVKPSKMNIFGGNLAFGHPFGASGATNLLHLMEAMKVTNAKKGIVSIAAAGGLGMAILIEKIAH
jgi:acetyl-CoA C-acetyltransferase